MQRNHCCHRSGRAPGDRDEAERPREAHHKRADLSSAANFAMTSIDSYISTLARAVACAELP
jgi:hypothetical protein